MNTKLSIEFNSTANTSLIEYLAVITASHNEGKCKMDLNSLQGYFKAYCARYDYNKAVSLLDTETQTLTLCMTPEQPFITISEHLIIGELSEYGADIINQENLG